MLPGRVPVGVAPDVHPVRAAGADAVEAAALVDAELNRMFLEPFLHGTYPEAARAELLPPASLIEPGDMSTISAPIDFLGLNYYAPHYVRLGDWDDLRRGESPLPGHPGVVNYLPPELPLTSMGWIVEPDGLYDTLRALDREAPRLPIYITENGCGADDYVTPEGAVNDFDRIDYIDGHLDAAWRAIQDGVNLSGYFHWSLMDNFEWARGYSFRFGLYYVDFGTQRRIPKRSAGFYSEVVAANALPPAAPVDGWPVSAAVAVAKAASG